MRNPNEDLNMTDVPEHTLYKELVSNFRHLSQTHICANNTFLWTFFPNLATMFLVLCGHRGKYSVFRGL